MSDFTVAISIILGLGGLYFIFLMVGNRYVKEDDCQIDENWDEVDHYQDYIEQMQWDVPESLLSMKDCEFQTKETYLEVSPKEAFVVGYKKEGPSQKRTVVLRTEDSGTTWSEMELNVVFWQKILFRTWYSWPPVDGCVDFLKNEKGSLVMYYSDPWLLENPSYWKGIYLPEKKVWKIVAEKSA